MHAMQYRIGLPSDYDMGIIRERVSSKGAALDGFAGLGLKAYLIREAGVAGSPINEYAPFYLWADLEGMKRFLYGKIGFGGIVESFGRPAVAHYNLISTLAGDQSQAQSSWAVLRTYSMDPGVDPGELVAARLASVRSSLAESASPAISCHSISLAVDPFTWTMIEFELLTERPGTERTTVEQPDGLVGVEVFEVLHTSRPEFDSLVGTTVDGAADIAEANAAVGESL